MKKVMAGKLLLASLVFSFLLLGTSQLRQVRAENNLSIAADVYEWVVGNIHNDCDDASCTGVTSFIGGLMDPALEVVAKCPVGGFVDFFERDIHSCVPVVIGQGSLPVTSRPNGSLYAIATNMHQVAMDTPPPVNLAYFINETKAESPFFRRAYAGPLEEAAFGAVLTAWKGMRNLAYGLLSLFVMIVAIMITLRKKIDAQTIVSAQSAIPRIAISAILIAFSYPLGSLFVQSIVPLTRVGMYLLGQTSASVPVQEGGPCPSMLQYFASAGQISNFTEASNCMLEATTRSTILADVGAVILDLGTVVVFMFTIIFYTIIYIGSFLIYVVNFIKILLLTIFSPIYFAIGAVPGQEHRVTDWFKEVISAVLALPAIIFILILGIMLALTSTFSGAQIPGAEAYLSKTFNGLVGAILMIIMGIMAMKAPGMIAAAVKGAKKR